MSFCLHDRRDVFHGHLSGDVLLPDNTLDKNRASGRLNKGIPVVPPQRSPSELDAFRRSLPVREHEREILQLIRENRVVLVVGETGSGKTTQVGRCGGRLAGYRVSPRRRAGVTSYGRRIGLHGAWFPRKRRLVFGTRHRFSLPPLARHRCIYAKCARSCSFPVFGDVMDSLAFATRCVSLCLNRCFLGVLIRTQRDAIVAQDARLLTAVAVMLWRPIEWCGFVAKQSSCVRRAVHF